LIKLLRYFTNLANLSGKLAFVSKDISNEQVLDIWQNSKPNAVSNLGDAINLLKKGNVDAILASRQSMEAQKDSSLRIFPNFKLIENRIVALFSPHSKDLQEEFNNALKTRQLQPATSSPAASKTDNKGQKSGTKERLDKMTNLLNELKKEIELLQKEVK